MKHCYNCEMILKEVLSYLEKHYADHCAAHTCRCKSGPPLACLSRGCGKAAGHHEPCSNIYKELRLLSLRQLLIFNFY